MSVSDKEYYQLTICISKALHGIETPLKTKHARATIIGTFLTRGAHAFWAITLRQPLNENRITAWKFCHLLHKVLREGHQLCGQHSMRHRSHLLELGKLWGHLNDGYGLSIRHYTKLLVTKLEFHDRNPRIPGSLTLKRGELEAITGNDVNFYFQMAVEMFDYLDDVIALQATIFNSITTFHVNSMTSAGQCRLSPLIPLIQDSNQLYDFLVRIMFKLHGNLPNDVLQGHRDRFRAIFTQLKSFYGQARNLQYFVNLITVPKLPESAPNFGSQVDFGSYTAPVVVVPEPEQPEPELVVDNLVDMSETDAPPPAMPPRPASSASNSSSSGSRQPTGGGSGAAEEAVAAATAAVRAAAEAQVQDMKRIVEERDDLIRHLHVEVDRLGKCMKSLHVQTRDESANLEQQVATLNSQLSDAHEQLTNMRFVKEELELKAQSAEKQLVEEERLKASDEKFQKLKLMYGSIRDEHVKLLRQHGDVSKQLAASTRTAGDATRERDEMRQQLDEVQSKQALVDERLQQSAQSDAAEVLQLRTENSVLSAKLEDAQAHREEETQQLRSQLAAMEAKHADLSAQVVQLGEQGQREVAASVELRRQLDELHADRDRTEERLQQSADSAQKDQTELAEKVQQLEEEKVAMEQKVQSLQAQVEAGTAELVGVKEQLEQANEQLGDSAARALDERSALESDMHDLLLEQEVLTANYTQSQAQQVQLQRHLDDVRIAQEAGLRALMQTCIRASENLTVRAMAENEVAAMNGTTSYFRMVAEELQAVLNEMVLVNAAYTNDADNNGEGLARKVILAGHLLATVHVQGMTVCNTCKDIEAGEKIADEIRAWGALVAELYRCLHTGAEPATCTAAIDAVHSQLAHLTGLIHDLEHSADTDAARADSIDAELSGMDAAIEEAATRIADLLRQSRASDSGVQLEVNERILDACTALMNSIRLLVQRARQLQAEIVALGRGSASATEFYKRNHQWTEGLISAAKNVAQGANFLVSAANKAISGGESRDQLDLIVAAQEIAACTAQLVVSSRVKAPRGSAHLAELSKASREVTQATGGVVAVVKDGRSRLEDQQDMDLSGLSFHQAKKLEMEIQVKVLELEQALQMERLRLASHRRKNYRES